MSPGPLPQCVNLRRAVTRNARYQGTLGPQQLPRFSDVLERDGDLAISVQFGEDEEGRQFADVEVEASVRLQCQRCLQPLSQRLTGRSRLALVLSDEHAKHLPAQYEPWIARDEVDLWEVAAEELALALPVVAYHDAGVCEAPPVPAGEEEHAAAPAENGSDSPFNVLSTLLGDDGKEK